MSRQTGYFEANGLRFHHARYGDQGRPMILFIHGFPEFHHMWLPLMAQFQDTHFCVAPDNRGYNLSDKPSDISAYKTREIVTDIAAMIAAWGYQTCTLVAHDWGGAAAWAFALRHPEMLDRLIILNATHPATFMREISHNKAQREASHYINFFRKDEAEEVLSANNYSALWTRMTVWCEDGEIFSAANKRAYLQSWAQPGAVTGMLNWYRAMPDDMPAPEAEDLDLLANFAKQDLTVRVPTLVLWGLKDTALLPGCIEGLGDYVPDLRLRTVEAGHFIAQEAPDFVAQEMQDYLRREA